MLRRRLLRLLGRFSQGRDVVGKYLPCLEKRLRLIVQRIYGEAIYGTRFMNPGRKSRIGVVDTILLLIPSIPHLTRHLSLQESSEFRLEYINRYSCIRAQIVGSHILSVILAEVVRYWCGVNNLIRTIHDALKCIL